MGHPVESDVIFVVAGGPSAAGIDFKALKPHGYILGVNDAVFNAPCDGVVSMDGRWMRNRWERLRRLNVDMFFRRVSVDKWLKNKNHDRLIAFDVDYAANGLSKSFKKLHGKNSGFMAFNYSTLCKPRQIYLFGFDLTLDKSGPVIREHWYQEYEWRQVNKRIASANVWAHDHNLSVQRCQNAGIEVFNVSPISIITAWPRITYDEIANNIARIR